MVEPGAADGGDGVLVQLLAEIDAEIPPDRAGDGLH
jgi:hypothetical protein